jgi:hypothetical protein
MKLTYIHLALIVIGVLMLVNLGYSVKEGLESQGSYTKNDEDKNDEDKNDEDKNDEDKNDEDSDKYILKSQIVPPVCPKCPDVTVCPNNNNSTGFVPQPFANKDYSSGYNVAPGSGSGPLTAAYEPRPMLTDFSQF